MDIGGWLQSLGLERYEAVFALSETAGAVSARRAPAAS